MTHRPYRTALLLLTLVACEEDDPGDATCALSGALSGDVAYTLPGPDGVACVTQFSSDDDDAFDGFDVAYATFNERSLRVDLGVEDVKRGLTGDAFPAEVRVVDGDITVASVDCSVDIDEHVLVGPAELGNEYWQVRGAGRCDGPLTNEAGESVTIAPFEFSAQLTWTN